MYVDVQYATTPTPQYTSTLDDRGVVANCGTTASPNAEMVPMPIPQHISTIHANTAPQPTTATAHPSTDNEDPTTSPPPSKKRKRNASDTKNPHILHQSTFRKSAWSYFHLRLITPGTASQLPPSFTSFDIDPLTISPLLHNPLTTYFGTTGAAIPIDTLKTCGREVWIRVPRQDARGVRAALAGWVGSCEGVMIPGLDAAGGEGRVRVAWRVIGEGGTVGGVSGDGADLFGD